MSAPHATFRLPEDGRWEFDGKWNAYRFRNGADSSVSYGQILRGFRRTLDYAATAGRYRMRGEGARHPVREDDRSVDGRECYVFSYHGEIGTLSHYGYIVGTRIGGWSVYILFEYPNDDAQSRAEIESVLASVQWRGKGS